MPPSESAIVWSEGKVGPVPVERVTVEAPPASAIVALFTEIESSGTSTVIVLADALSAVPSLTLKVKLARSSPDSPVGGVYLSLPPSMSAFATDWSAVTAVPPSVRVPVPEAGSVTILTL